MVQLFVKTEGSSRPCRRDVPDDMFCLNIIVKWYLLLRQQNMARRNIELSQIQSLKKAMVMFNCRRNKLHLDKSTGYFYATLARYRD